MKANYKDDTEKGPGYGFIVFSEILPPSGPWSITLQRSYDQNFLAQDGKWVGELAYIPLDGELADDGAGLQLSIAPTVVDALDPQQQYRISLKGSEGDPQTSRLHIGNITFSRDESHDNTARKTTPPLEKTPPKTAPDIAQPVAQTPVAEKPTDPIQEPLSAPAPVQKKRWPLVVLALLVMAGLLAWVLSSALSDDKEQAASAPATPQKQQEESVEAQVKKFFSQASPSAGTALSLAEKLSKNTPADQDAVYRLYYFAAENNDPKAYIPYADCLNPVLPAWGSIHKNAPEAAQFYEKAMQSDPDAARQALEKMTNWLNEQAASGNNEAKAWLEQLKK